MLREGHSTLPDGTLLTARHHRPGVWRLEAASDDLVLLVEQGTLFVFRKHGASYSIVLVRLRLSDLVPVA